MRVAEKPEVGWLFTGLGGTRRLAGSLMFHYDVSADEHPEVLAELDDVLGEELLSVTRHVLMERGLLPDPTEA